MMDQLSYWALARLVHVQLVVSTSFFLFLLLSSRDRSRDACGQSTRPPSWPANRTDTKRLEPFLTTCIIFLSLLVDGPLFLVLLAVVFTLATLATKKEENGHCGQLGAVGDVGYKTSLGSY